MNPVKEVDALFAEWDKLDSPGAAVAVVRDEEVILAKGYGAANLEYGLPITPSSVFDIASVSKQLAAMAIAMLVQEGKLSLEDDMRAHLPDVPDFGKTVTIRHLIHHTSGLRDRVGALAIAGWRMEDVISFKDILWLVRSQRELNFDPGAEMLYSNTGYNLLARIVEVTSGQSFAQWTEEKLFKPLGMSKSRFHDDHQRIVKDRVDSYEPDSGTPPVYKKVGNGLMALGSSSLYSTVEDLAKWVINLETGTVGGAAVLVQMRQRGPLNNGEFTNYAFGLSLGKYRGLATEKHDGSWAGFRTTLIHFPDQKFGVVLLSNLATFNPSKVAYQVADLYLADQLVEPNETENGTKRSQLRAFEIEPELFDAYSGDYALEEQPATIFSFWRVDNRYFTRASGRHEAEILPSSDSTFFLKDEGNTVVFHRDENGEASRLTVSQNGERTAHRVPTFVQDTEALAEYAGSYTSPELQVTYRLVIEGEMLVTKHPRNEDIAMRPYAKDRFGSDSWIISNIDFERDAMGVITRARVSNGRSKNILFERNNSHGE